LRCEDRSRSYHDNGECDKYFVHMCCLFVTWIFRPLAV
jgi:hypothetical protein